MSRPHATITKALKNHLTAGERLLVAVSGGIDSMSLLHACVQLQKRLKLTIEAAHVDHRLRPASAHDANFVARQCQALQVPLHVLTAPDKPSRRNSEEWGRSIRYAYFKEILAARALQKVLTAHTANDVAETLLMRLVSNKELSTIMSWDKRRSCLRPLLEVSRAEIESYAKDHEVPYVEDPTNRDTALLRNRVRHVLIPLLEREFDKRIVEVLSQRALALQDDAEALDATLSESLTRIGAYAFGTRQWLRTVHSELQQVGEPIQWRLAQRLLESKLGFKMGRKKSEDVLKVIDGTSIAVQIPGGRTLRARQGGLVLS